MWSKQGNYDMGTPFNNIQPGSHPAEKSPNIHPNTLESHKKSMAEATKGSLANKSSKTLNILRVAPVDSVTTWEDIIWAITNTTAKGLISYQYIGGKEKASEF